MNGQLGLSPWGRKTVRGEYIDKAKRKKDCISRGRRSLTRVFLLLKTDEGKECVVHTRHARPMLSLLCIGSQMFGSGVMVVGRQA